MFRQRVGPIVAGVYLTAAAVAGMLAAVTGDLGPLWTVVVWNVPGEHAFTEPSTAAVLAAAGLFAILALKTWMLRQVLAFPPRAAPPGGTRVVWARRGLYLAVAFHVAGRLPAALLPGDLAVVLALLPMGAQTVSFALVLSGRRMRMCVLAAALAASAATAAIAFYDEIEPLPPPMFFYVLWVPVLSWQVVVLAGQRRDGRWSRATLRAGLVAACLTLVSPYPGAGLEWAIGGPPGLPDEGLGVFLVVWLARSAHELAGPGALPEELGPPRRLPRPILLAGVLLPFLVLVAPEAAPPPAGYAWQLEPPRTGNGQAVDTEDYVAEANARCRDPWPRVRARRQGTAAYFLFEGGGYVVYDPDGTGEGEDVVGAAIEDGFVAAAGSSAAVMTYGENEPMCLTVKAFGSAPPLRLKGWEQVAEVGVVSRSGRLEVPAYADGGDEGAGRPLPNLAARGPGRYRLRVYARVHEEIGEQHLVVVFPGRSAGKVVYR
ncbi:hypothetical protein [Microbispora hainanensis]|uniref:Uncharacterized protein n=1 Tax=Microbispora hainanensis TaxID=568844 RepID=A0A544YNA9_9ACTN|nr:hypothetical protein [Microbispora hainanensis]TQS18186.1 hypothetical protein FLX08_25620 [Microbispora hainanensis]